MTSVNGLSLLMSFGKAFAYLFFLRGPESLLSKFKELSIRSWVVKKLAHIYIERNVHDLEDRPGVLKIHAYERCASITGSLKQHANRRIDL